MLLLSHFSGVQPHRRQPTRLPRPWDSPGKNSGVGCHFLPQHMKVKSEREVAQLCLTCSDPMDCSLPGSSIHGIFQARVLEQEKAKVKQMFPSTALHTRFQSSPVILNAAWYMSLRFICPPTLPLINSCFALQNFK